MCNERAKTVHVGPGWRLVLEDLEVDAVAVLRRVGLPIIVFDGEGSRIPLDDFYALYDAVEAECSDPAMPLRAGKAVSVELFEPALFAAICSSNMNTAAERLGQFKRLVGAFSLEVDIRAEETEVRYRCKHRPDLPRALALSEVVFLVAFARRATREPIVPRRVTVQQLPVDPEPYETYFGCPLDKSNDCAVVFTAADALRPFLTHNARMWESFQPDLRRRMAEAADARSTTEQVEAALLELLPSGRPQLRDVARELGMGTRTLQRRLSSEDTTWLAVVNDTRERLACHYLESTQTSLAEISFLLGFEDPNSLFRAFQRWTGTTPESWRAHART